MPEAPRYTLLSATPSPYARKVRIQLAEKCIPFELVTEVPWNTDSNTPRYNPLEKLPVLICADGTTVYESRFINEWIEMKHPDPPLVPKEADDILAVKRFEVLADGIVDACVLIFFERSRGPDRSSPEWTARQQRKADGGLRELSNLLGKHQFCLGDFFTMADIAVGSALGWLKVRMPDLPWQERHPNLAALSGRLEQRPSFRDTVPYPQVIRDRVA